MMFNKLILGSCVAALALTACKQSLAPKTGVMDKMGIAIDGSKVKAIDNKCFYQAKRPKLPDNVEDIEFQYVVIDNIGKPQLRRLRPNNAEGQNALYNEFQGYQNNSNWDDWYEALPALRSADLIPTNLAVPPFIPNRNAAVRGLAASTPNPYQPANRNFANGPSSLDVIMYKHSRVSFVLNENEYKFDPKNPFEVYSGDGKNLPPFYYNKNLVKLNADRNILTVEFYSDDAKIPASSDCVYDYQLNVISTTTNAEGIVFSTRITIDPGGGRGRP